MAKSSSSEGAVIVLMVTSSESTEPKEGVGINLNRQTHRNRSESLVMWE